MVFAIARLFGGGRRRRSSWIIGLVASLGLLVGGAAQLPTALHASHGQGTHGTWVADHRFNGTWYGKFLLPNGSETHSDVKYDGSLSSVHAGTSVPALDSGDSNQVYPVSGSHHWIESVIYIVLGAIGLIVIAGAWLYQRLARRRGLVMPG